MAIYAGGDTVAALILGEFGWTRVAGLMLAGGFVYAWEIPRYFAWIDRVTAARRGFAGTLVRTALAMLYFNPLWIARHLLFVMLASGRAAEIGWDLLATASASFLGAVPISIAGNFVIQNLLPLRHRFTASALFSAGMAVYYAASLRWFA
ncbi:MAG: hypothetical protein FIB01_12160 [Gemmatimonadetes bacterium]|nr:hypothetical protein [Gemmatimonadota bacterium]